MRMQEVNENMYVLAATFHQKTPLALQNWQINILQYGV